MAKKKPNNIEKALGAVGQDPLNMPEVDVEIEEEMPMEDEGVSIELGEDGSATITLGEEEEDLLCLLVQKQRKAVVV